MAIVRNSLGTSPEYIVEGRNPGPLMYYATFFTKSVALDPVGQGVES